MLQVTQYSGIFIVFKKGGVIMHNGYRFRLYPTPEQTQILLRWIGCQRVIYNAKVSEDRYFRKFRQHQIDLIGAPIPIDQGYSHYIGESTGWLKDVPSQLLRNGAVLWKQAYARYFEGLGGRPTYHSKRGEQSVWLTSELFHFEPAVDQETGEILGHKLFVGTKKKFFVGELVFKAHREYVPPVSIHISVHAGKWYVAFSAEDGTIQSFQEETILASFQGMSEQKLEAITVGADRGVAKPLVASNGKIYDLSDIQKERIQKERTQKKKWQHKAAKRKKDSKNQRKAYQKAARYQQYEANVRRDFAHKTSHDLVSCSNAKIIVFEDLKIKNMTKRPKPKKDEKGQWTRNGARAKAGLSRSILASAWGQIETFTKYKALRAGKILIKVAPQYSSQTCAECDYVDAGNRPSQAEFHCLRCEHEENADHNAARVIKKRGITKILEGYQPKEKKTVKIYKEKLGSERSKVTPVENLVRRSGGNAATQGSKKQEILLATAGNPHSSAKR